MGFVACSNKPTWLEHRAADDENSQKNGQRPEYQSAEPIRVEHVASPEHGTDSETNHRQTSESYNEASQGPPWFCVEHFDQSIFFYIGAVYAQ